MCDDVGAWWNNGGQEAVATGARNLICGAIVVGGIALIATAPGLASGLLLLA